MSTEWRFADVEHIFMKHAKSKGAKYDPKKPLGALDKGAIKKAGGLLGFGTWGTFASVTGVSRKTMEKWGENSTRATVECSIFPTFCDAAARPYKEHREAYESSTWLPQYIEESVAYALTRGTATPEDSKDTLNDAWDRYNVATLLLAAFTLSGDELEHVATAARYAIAAQPYGATVRTQRPYPSNDTASNLDEAESLMQKAKEMEREAVNRVPFLSVASINFDQLRAIVEEREKLIGHLPND